MKDKEYIKRKLQLVDQMFTATYKRLSESDKSIKDVKKQIKLALTFFRKLKRKSGMKLYSTKQMSDIRKAVFYSKDKEETLAIFNELRKVVKKMLSNLR